MGISKEHLLWFIIGLLFALFVLPMIQQFIAARKASD